MSSKTQTTTVKPSIGKFLLGGLIAGGIAAVLNNLYNVIYASATGFSSELIHFGSVTGASLLPMLAGAGLYWAISKATTCPRATAIFMVISVSFTLLSLYGPLQPTLPDGQPTPAGFAGLTLPMHMLTGLAAVIVLPRVIYKH